MAIKIALAGNPNCGKTTLFNGLTGSNQFVGNWPGVTVEKKEGKLKKSYAGEEEVVITDLPGIYSLSPYTLEEVVARNYLTRERPDAIINIVDGTNLERNLYLTTQLQELGIPVVMAVNMSDLLEKNGDVLNAKKLEEKLGCPVTTISALKGTGLEDACRLAVKAAKAGKTAGRKGNVLPYRYDEKLETAISAVEAKFSVAEGQKRFFAIKLLEQDDKIGELMGSMPDVSVEIKGLEDAFDDDTESIITNERYTFISSIIAECIQKKNRQKEAVSDKIDKIVTNRILALPIFAVVMFVVYYISVTTVGTWATDWTNDGLFGDGFHLFGMSGDYDEETDAWADEYIFTEELENLIAKAQSADVKGVDDVAGAVEEADFGAFEEAYGFYGEAFEKAGFVMDETFAEGALELNEEGEAEFAAPDPAEYGVWIPGIPVLAERGLDAVHCAKGLKCLILDGIIGGVGAVLGFVPQMLVLFIFLAFLEACGYMARIAFVMDRIFRKFGLSGKSFIPMLIGSGCGVPGIMASRTIENDRDRKMTIMTTTFIPCGAKLPIIALIAGSLFNNSPWIAPSAYFIGVAAIVISGIVLKKTKMFAGEPAPFVMELPAYHWPTAGNVLRSMWERGWSFIKKAGTIILLSSILIWFSSVFGNTGRGFGFDPDMELADSVLGMIGNGIKWIFAPLGFGDATAAVATIMGLVAKEEVVGVFGVLDFVAMTKLAAYSFLIFNLLCAPCFAAIGAIRREMNSARWTWFAIGYQCVFAYVVSLIVYQLGSAFTGNMNIVGLIVAILLIAGLIYLLFRPYKEADKLTAAVRVAKAK